MFTMINSATKELDPGDEERNGRRSYWLHDKPHSVDNFQNVSDGQQDFADELPDHGGRRDE